MRQRSMKMSLPICTMKRGNASAIECGGITDQQIFRRILKDKHAKNKKLVPYTSNPKVLPNTYPASTLF
jgi:hypothetical protein